MIYQITTRISLPSKELPSHCWTGVIGVWNKASIRSRDRSKEEPSMDDGGEGWFAERKVVIGEGEKQLKEVAEEPGP